MRAIPDREHAEQPEQQHDADPEQHPAGVALGAVADVKRSGFHPVLRCGGISGCAHLGGDDLQRIPAAVHHQVFPGRRRGSAELVDIRAGAFQHGASHPLTFLGMLMCVVYIRSRNILAPIILHSLWNAFAFVELIWKPGALFTWLLDFVL